MRASRLLSILMSLQAHGARTADQLAEELEVSVRTIHRDIDELSAAGIPVYAERGRFGGFRLLDGYQTRLTGLSAEEASVLMLSGVGAALDDLGLSETLTRTEGKLRAALPAATRASAGLVASRFHLDPVGWYRRKDETPVLPRLARAVWTDRQIEISYTGWTGDVRRRLDPLAIVLKAGVWYLIARAIGLRVYRIGNISDLRVLDDSFERPPDFAPDAFWRDWSADFEARIRPHRATLRATGRGLARMRNLGLAVHALSEPDRPDQHLVEIPVEDGDATIRDILALGAEVEIVAPAHLRQAIQNEIHRLSALYADP